MFQLTKWYLDLVTEQGDTLIAYAARLNLKLAGVPLYYSSVLLSRPSAPDDETSIGGGAFPSIDGDVCDWRADALGISGRWHRTSSPIARTLVDGPDGSITWTCHMPRARVEVSYHGVAQHGTGYVERLEMSIPPWKLPFRTLRWGRHLSDRHALAWIEWDDGSTGRWAWLDGTEQPGARPVTTGIAGLTGDRELRLRDSRDVRNRGVLQGITRMLPALQGYAAGRLAGMREHKQLSRSALFAAGHAIDDGWALHEVVTW